MTYPNNKNSTDDLSESTQNPKKQNHGQPEKSTPKNLGGRPPGSKNTLTLLQEAAQKGIMAKVLDRFDNVVETTIRKAEEGDPTCLKLLWDRTVPIQKSVDGTKERGIQGITIVVQGSSRIAETIEDAEIIEDITGD